MNDPFEIVGVRPELLERQAPEKGEKSRVNAKKIK